MEHDDFAPAGVLGGPEPKVPPVTPPSNPNAPNVLPSAAFVTGSLPPEKANKLNIINLVYAHEVAKAQARAYRKLLTLFDCTDDDLQVDDEA